jgi:hypothetical protein
LTLFLFVVLPFSLVVPGFITALSKSPKAWNAFRPNEAAKTFGGVLYQQADVVGGDHVVEYANEGNCFGRVKILGESLARDNDG